MNSFKIVGTPEKPSFWLSWCTFKVVRPFLLQMITRFNSKGSDERFASLESSHTPLVEIDDQLFWCSVGESRFSYLVRNSWCKAVNKIFSYLHWTTEVAHPKADEGGRSAHFQWVIARSILKATLSNHDGYNLRVYHRLCNNQTPNADLQSLRPRCTQGLSGVGTWCCKCWS